MRARAVASCSGAAALPPAVRADVVFSEGRAPPESVCRSDTVETLCGEPPPPPPPPRAATHVERALCGGAALQAETDEHVRALGGGTLCGAEPRRAAAAANAAAAATAAANAGGLRLRGLVGKRPSPSRRRP